VERACLIGTEAFLAGIRQYLLGETIDALPGEFARRILALGLEVPRETGAGLFLLFEFLRLPDGVDEIRSFGGEVGPNLI